MAGVVPVGALQQFLAALKAKEFEGAKALAFQILTDEPDNIIVRRALPVINLHLAAQGESDSSSSEEEEGAVEAAAHDEGEPGEESADESDGTSDDSSDTGENDEESEGEGREQADEGAQSSNAGTVGAAEPRSLVGATASPGNDGRLATELRSLVDTLAVDQ
ncbi:hypothetical protein AB1Y20_023021 [Prymnesium parvum]|uniref:Uncharacterized protein n=1 Tax=Prymnesium parvum TaxID=97485 RepID=A0AB34JFV6_PRYPA